jgi:hypothetical protein
MAWAKHSGSAPKYRIVAHRTTRTRHMTHLKAAGHGRCAEVVCVYPSRTITPDMDLHLCHDVTGTTVLGLGHAKCNIAAAAREARHRQTPTPHRSDVW